MQQQERTPAVVFDGLDEALSKLAVLRNQAPTGAESDEDVMLVLADIHSQVVQAQRILSAPPSEYMSVAGYSVASRASVPSRRGRSNSRGSRDRSKERYVGDGGYDEYDGYARQGGQDDYDRGDFDGQRQGGRYYSADAQEDEDAQYLQDDSARNISTTGLLVSEAFYRDSDRERAERARRHRDKDRQRQRDRDAGVEPETRDSDRDRDRPLDSRRENGRSRSSSKEREAAADQRGR